MILASFGSIFALSWALIARDREIVRSPSFVATPEPAAAGTLREAVALAAQSAAASDIAPKTGPIAATVLAPGSATCGAADPTGGMAIPASAPSIYAEDAEASGPFPEGRRPAFVHAKLSLFAPDEPAVGAAGSAFSLSALVSAAADPTAPSTASAETTAPMTVAMSPLYRQDLDALLTLTALDFPFSESRDSVSGGPGRNAVAASRGASASAADPESPSLASTQAIDPIRFGGQAAWQGYAPEPDRPEARPFADFALGSTGPSWRRLSNGTADDALALGARADGGGGFGDQGSGETRAFLSRNPVAAHLLAEATASGADAASKTLETEEAFFAPDNASRKATVADAIERAAGVHGLTATMTTQLLNLLAAEYDFGGPVAPEDRLDVFFSEGDGADLATATSEFYYIRATFGGAYRAFYRFASDDGSVAYFGPEGRSAEEMLLRHPVPSGRLQSGFGMRRHPILGYERMHDGIDWSAPQGTPIFATASGTVERAGSRGGYGLQTVIRHDNGYATSYAHQSALADAVSEGAFVRQGDVIGFVGSSGLATGAHIHYEVMRDGVAIDPMDAPTSEGPLLRGERLDAFLAERDRIDAIVYNSDDSVLRVAAVPKP